MSAKYKYQFGCGISKMAGPKKQDFWPRINIPTQRKSLYFMITMNESLSNIVLSKSIFFVKN